MNSHFRQVTTCIKYLTTVYYYYCQTLHNKLPTNCTSAEIYFTLTNEFTYLMRSPRLMQVLHATSWKFCRIV